MQPEKAAVVRGWMTKAAGDLRGACIDLDADPPFVEDALFHCQQAAEKSPQGIPHCARYALQENSRS